MIQDLTDFKSRMFLAVVLWGGVRNILWDRCCRLPVGWAWDRGVTLGRLPGPSDNVAQISEAQDRSAAQQLSGPLNHSLLVVSPRVPRAVVDCSLGWHGWGSCLMRYDRAPCACFCHRSVAFHLLGRYVESAPSHLYAWAY